MVARCRWTEGEATVAETGRCGLCAQGYLGVAHVSADQARYIGMEGPAEIRIGNPGFVVLGDHYHENPY
jgi:hypothetical protein